MPEPKGRGSFVDYDIFDLGDVRLQQGATLTNAKLAYKTYGELRLRAALRQ